MKAMVFAAGYGERLRPLTERVPKALVPVGGRPMIEYPLLLLKHYGITQIIINLHHLGGKIKEHLRDGTSLGLQITYSEETELLDTGGGLLRARAFLAENTFIVINSDVIIDLALSELLDQHQKRGAIATLVLRPDPRADLYGAIETSEDLRIQRFLAHKAPRSEAAGDLTKYMFTGVQVLEPGVFDYMVDEGPFGITRMTYPKMLVQGEPLYGFPFRGYWQDLGTAERIGEAEAKFRSGEVRLHYLKY
ncbi:MAG: NDP-sugar synthase [Deltaproteobacteria bacterium]|nr:NDP-sugar synthase [Deltaproteobacteria bacterium]